MGLNDLSKKEVENVFSYVLSKYDSVDDFLNSFDGLLQSLYQNKDYKGDWNRKDIDNMLNDYTLKTDAIKQDYKDKKMVKLLGSVVIVAGGIISLTPIAPYGWGLLGVGGGMSAITDVVDLADKSKQDAWRTAKDKLKAKVENPFEGTVFKMVYDSIMSTFAVVKDKVSNDDYSIIIQGLGWNYFLFRSQGYNHEAAVRKLAEVCELFRTQRYVISTKLKDGDKEAIEDIQCQIAASTDDLLKMVGALGMIGISVGIGVGAIISGIRIAGLSFRGAETLAHAFLSIGNGAMRFMNFMKKAGPVIVIVGGVASIVVNAMELNNLEKTFKPYYDYKDACKKLLDDYENSYDDINNAICKMYEFIKEDISKKE